jgi:hypothetical protein
MAYDNSLIADLKTVLGWDDYQDTGEIPSLGSPYNDTVSGQFYQQFNSAVRLDNILACLPVHSTLSDLDKLKAYLDKTETTAINEALNEIETIKQIDNQGKNLVSSKVIFKVGRKVSTQTNQSYFCGVMFEVKNSVSIRATINRIGLYLTGAVTNLDLYLFHSSKEAVVQQFTFTSAITNSFAWNEIERILDFDDGTNTGGTWYLGYYQDDLSTQTSAAISYNAMNWVDGYCGSCGTVSASEKNAYAAIRDKVIMSGFYVPAASLPVSKTERFEPNVVIKTNTNNWGFNFHISVTCNLTQFWKENKKTLKNVIGLSVAMKVLSDMKASAQINNVSEHLKVMIIRDLEGANDTGLKPLWELREEAINALILDEGNISKDCLPCARKPRTNYRAIG